MTPCQPPLIIRTRFTTTWRRALLVAALVEFALAAGCSNDDGAVLDAAAVAGGDAGADHPAILGDAALPADAALVTPTSMDAGIDGTPDTTPVPDGACVTTGTIPGVIYFSRAGAQPATDEGIVCTVAGNGTNEQFLTAGKAPRRSPTGRYVLFHRGNASYNRGNLWVLDQLAAGETMVFTNNDYAVGFTFTPDESQIIFDYQCVVEIANRDGSNRRQFLQFTDCYSDSPSARVSDGAVVFQNAHVGLGLANAAGTSVAAIPNTAPGDYWPAWTPDGQWVTFGRWPASSPGVVALYKVRPDGTGLAQVGSITNPVEGGAVSADGRWLVEYGTRDGVMAFYAFDLTGTDVAPLRVCPPDGNPIEFVGSVAAN